MMVCIIGILIYLLSIVGIRWVYRLHSSKYCKVWSDRQCQVEFIWFVPIVNIIAIFVCLTMLLSVLINRYVSIKLNIKDKWLNRDL